MMCDVMIKDKFLKISSYAELMERRQEFEGVKLDKEMLEHASKLFPKVSNTKEELYKTRQVKAGQ